MILIINPGSGTVKYSLYKSDDAVYTGMVDIKDERRFDSPVSSIVDDLISGEEISSIDDIDIVGFRLVNGGDQYSETTEIDDSFIDNFSSLVSLAPYHNAKAYECIKEAKGILGQIPMYGVFDTAFHKSIPDINKVYAFPKDLSDQYSLRKYGFHGISYEYLISNLAEKYDREGGRHIFCHLGSGCSMSAVKGGRCINTTMGFTPVSGLMSAKRTGDFDPSLVFHLNRNGMEITEIEDLINKKSGLLGLSGTRDMKELLDKSAQGDSDAKLAEDKFVNDVVKFIGQFVFELGGIDAIVFSGGIGEQSFYLRNEICKKLDFYGIKLDMDLNNANKQGLISDLNSSVEIYMIQTSEEKMIYDKIKNI